MIKKEEGCGLGVVEVDPLLGVLGVVIWYLNGMLIRKKEPYIPDHRFCQNNYHPHSPPPAPQYGRKTITIK